MSNSIYMGLCPMAKGSGEFWAEVAEGFIGTKNGTGSRCFPSRRLYRCSSEAR